MEYFRKLPGCWKIDRKISDGSNLLGVVNITEWERDRFKVEETGALKLASGLEVSAQRCWIWQCPTPNRMEILYAEKPPRMYHRVPLVKSNAEWCGVGKHVCESDTYLGRYVFREGHFVIEQNVAGPKKGYSMRTVYSAMTVGLPDH